MLFSLSVMYNVYFDQRDKATSRHGTGTYVDSGFVENTRRHVRERNVLHFVVVCGVDAGHAQFVVVVTCAELHAVHYNQELSHTGCPVVVGVVVHGHEPGAHVSRLVVVPGSSPRHTDLLQARVAVRADLLFQVELLQHHLSVECGSSEYIEGLSH